VNRIGVTRCLLAAVLFGASAPAASQLAGDVPTLALAGLLYLGAGLAVLPSIVRRPVGARYSVVAGQAACWYSLMRPLQRVDFTT
jgi:drug/metabolite transporter (DMT)-like permease